jgi:pimeloyl-ACP methyl ester carboxylesterase
MRAGWAYFVSFLQAARAFAQLSQTKLTMPVLTIGGDKSLGEALGEQAKLVTTDATVVVLKNTGHWVLEERPQETTEALQKLALCRNLVSAHSTRLSVRRAFEPNYWLADTSCPK